VFKMSSTSFHTSSSVKIMKSTADAGKQRSSFRARVRCNAQLATMSSCARRLFKHFNFKFRRTIRYIPKSGEFLSLAKFNVWFCDSLVNLPYSKSIHNRMNVVISARTARSSASLTPHRTASRFSVFTTYSDQKPCNLCQEIL